MTNFWATKSSKGGHFYLSRRLKCTIVISRCPSSVCRPSVVNFSNFQLLLWNRWTEFNETWQEARSQGPLPSLCFLGRSEKQDGRPGLWLAGTFSTSALKPLKGIQRNLTGSKISTSSTKFVFFGPIGKTRWPPWPLIGWYIFDFSSETDERNSKKLDRKQDFNVLYQICVFRVDWKNKMAVLASDWLGHFRLLLWNRWTEFNETLQEARSQGPLPSLCSLGWSEKQDGRPGLWLAGTFSTSPLKPLNRIQRNLTGSKISTFSTKFVFFRLMSKQKFLPWLICQKYGTLYSGARYVALWASCFLIKDDFFEDLYFDENIHKFLGPVLQKVHFAPQVRHLRDVFNAMCDFPFIYQNSSTWIWTSLQKDNGCIAIWPRTNNPIEN